MSSSPSSSTRWLHTEKQPHFPCWHPPFHSVHAWLARWMRADEEAFFTTKKTPCEWAFLLISPVESIFISRHCFCVHKASCAHSSDMFANHIRAYKLVYIIIAACVTLSSNTTTVDFLENSFHPGSCYKQNFSCCLYSSNWNIFLCDITYC